MLCKLLGVPGSLVSLLQSLCNTWSCAIAVHTSTITHTFLLHSCNDAYFLCQLPFSHLTQSKWLAVTPALRVCTAQEAGCLTKQLQVHHNRAHLGHDKPYRLLLCAALPSCCWRRTEQQSPAELCNSQQSTAHDSLIWLSIVIHSAA